MNKIPGVTIAKRLRNVDLVEYSDRIERDFPDPVLRFRLEQVKAAGKSQQPNLETAYSDMNLIRPPFSMAVMTRLLDLDPYLCGAVEAIATNVSACELEVVWTGDGDGNKKQQKTLNEFFFEANDPTNPMSLQEKLRVCAMDYIALGSWNLEIVQGGEKLMDLVHAPAEFVRVRVKKKDKILTTAYVMIKDGVETPFSVYGDENRVKENNQILRAIRKRPGHRVYGKPATYSLVNTVLMNSLRDEKNLTWFDQGSLADLLILVEENIDDGIKKQIIADYQNTSDGTQTMYILHGVGKAVVRELKRSLEDTSFDKFEQNNRQRVLSALRTPPAKVAIYQDANRANSITQDEVFRNEVIKPIQDTFRVRFNHVIKYGFGFPGWEFRIKPYSLRDRKEEADILKTYIDCGIYTVNQALATLNLPPVEGGDRRVVNTPLGLVDVATWTVAVAANSNINPQQAQRLAETEAGQLVLALAAIRRKLLEYK